MEEFTSQMRDRGARGKGKETVVGSEEGGLTVGEIGGGEGAEIV